MVDTSHGIVLVLSLIKLSPLKLLVLVSRKHSDLDLGITLIAGLSRIPGKGLLESKNFPSAGLLSLIN